MDMRVGRLIDECINQGAQHVDCISVIAKKMQVDYVNGEFSINKSSSRVYVLRALVEGNWGLSLSFEPSMEMVDQALSQARAKGPGGVKLAKRRPVQGGYVMCQKKAIVDGDGSEVIDYVKAVVKNIEKQCQDAVKSIEVHIEASHTARAMMSSDGVNAYELKPSIIASFTAQIASGESASVEVCGSGGFEVLEGVNPRSIADAISFRLNCMLKARQLNPYYKGFKFDVVLSPQTSASLIQVVVESTLNAYSYRHDIDGISDELTIIDDPTMDGGYGSFFFDDEGVKAKRKKLIESGKIVSLIHNRETAYMYGVEPTGNGRGLAEPPQPRHSNIIVEPGDWSFEEMIEETRIGLLIDGVRDVHVIDEYVMLEPEAALVIKKGEVKEPVKISYLATSLREFYSKIKGVGSGPLGSSPGSICDCKSASYSPPIKIELRAF